MNAKRYATGYPLRGKQGGVIDALGRAIVTGEFPSESTLPAEKQLLEHFCVSRTSLREAVKILAAKGLVETRQKVGTLVRPRSQWNILDADVLGWHDADKLDEKLMLDLIEMRSIIEPYAARLAAVRADREDHDRLGKAVADMRAAFNDPEAYEAGDVSFHKAVFMASHNQILVRFCDLIGNSLRMSFRLQQSVQTTADYRSDCEDHASVLIAILSGDAIGAEETMHHVVFTGKRALLQALRRRQPAHIDMGKKI